jgi:23S rRNA-/tRNA-specific pseudouridylate synthase
MALPPILYQDDLLVAFDKPSGLSVATDRWAKGRPTMMAEIRRLLGRQVANVHHLDPEASGVVLCAKTKPALDFLTGQFQGKTAEKKYLALAVVLASGEPGGAIAFQRGPGGELPAEFAIDLALGADTAHPGRTRIARKRDGKPSLTEFRVLERFGRFAWLECRPLTGRRHQVRVHLAAAGAPVLNDAFYGDPEIRLMLSDLKRSYKGREAERPLLGRLALHASEVTFRHPSSGRSLTVSAPLPKEFNVALKYLRKFGGGIAEGRSQSRPVTGPDGPAARRRSS